MIKLMTLLTLVAVVWTLVSYRKVDTKLISGSVETPSSLSFVKDALAPETLGIATSKVDESSGNIFTSSKLGFSLRYPEGVEVKTSADGSVLLYQNGLKISISQFKLNDKDTVNTIAEQDANSLSEKLGDKFRLIETISPVAIGSETGVLFSSEESGKEVTYFYVPQGLTYLFITNRTESTTSEDLISVSDAIIYSIHLLP